MRYPEVFYYYEKRNKPKFNKSPKGGETLDAVRLAQQLDAWRELKLKE